MSVGHVTIARERVLACSINWAEAQRGTELERERAHFLLLDAVSKWNAAVDEFAAWSRAGRP